MINRIAGNRPTRERPTRDRPARERQVRPAAREASAAAGGERPSRPVRERANASPRERPAPPPEATGNVPEDMLILIRELTTLLTWENTELEAHRVDGIRETLERKEALSRAYLEKMIVIKRKPDHLKDLPAARRAALAEAGAALDKAMERNGALLKAKVEAVNRLMGSVVDAVRDYKTSMAAAYAGNGRMDDRHAGPRDGAVALNKEF